MGVYTVVSGEEINEILSLYDLGVLLDFRPLSLGISNSNYQIEVKSKNGNRHFLLKISNDKGVVQLEKEQDILEYLAKVKYPYSICGLKTKDGNLLYQSGHKVGVIFPFLEGIPPGPSDQTCMEIGKSLATLHQIEKRDHFDQLRSHEEVGYSEEYIKNYVDCPECPKDFKTFFENIFEDKLNDYLKNTFETGLIHGDLYYDNTLFDHNKIRAVLDFEQSGRGAFIFDLGISISGTCIEKDRIIRPLIKSYLKGYEKIRPLPPLEKEFLNISILIGLFSISLWRIKRFKEGSLDPSRRDSYKELLQRAINFKNSLAELRRSPNK